LAELGRAFEGAAIAVAFDETEHLGLFSGGDGIVVGAQEPQASRPILVHEPTERGVVDRRRCVRLSHRISVHPAAAGAGTTCQGWAWKAAFIDRNAAREAALAWRASLASVSRLKVHACSIRELDAAWAYFERPDLRKLSATDAVSFVLMTRQKIRIAFTFDAHFATAGFRIVG